MSLKLLTTIMFFFFILSSGVEALSASYEDSLGRRITLKEPPRRIVPLAPSLTEILYFLGVGEHVVGVTTFSNYPAAAAGKPKVGTYISLNVEKIISLSPDLVIGTVDGNRPYVVELLEQAGIPVFIVNPRNVTQTLETIEILGKISGAGQKARELFMSLKERVDNIREKTRLAERPKVFVQINIKPIMTVNRNTFLDDLVRLAGGQNLFCDEPLNYPRISLEEVIKRKPEVIIVTSMDQGGKFEEVRKEWLKWQSIPASKKGMVYLIDSDISNRPSPRIVDALEQMARFIHPEIRW